ncbi:LysE family translocator [Sessilibacter corallicola]|uniref:LysE family translocator n=1 Tax=Sessilibacter corallicola TaxID=2904075 RepID=UPI001E4A6A09|nr:LysE family translocator [Sessilibacter corallicola]MCE2029389.1 LysE family translocator [Sessilibacter corallicola]
MDIDNILAFIAVATLLVISPGPNGLLITKTVPILGRKAGFANIAGFVAAFYVHGTLSIFGISLLLVQSAQAFFIFKLVGAAYLIWVGVKTLINNFKSEPVNQPCTVHDRKKTVSIYGAFIEGFLTNVLNPKVSMFYLAAFPQFISADQSPVSAYLLVASHALVNVVWFSLMIVMLSKVKSISNTARFKKWLNSVTGVVFIGFGAKLALLESK